jgi:ubiquinone/menaquinone biosynthesis C-methylase UbiE
VPADNAAAWDRYADAYQAAARLPLDVAHYGPDIATEADLRLLGELRGKRVLELGCGAAQCSIVFAKQGATAIAVDFSAEQLAHARRLAEQEGVKLELHHGDVADLAFLRGDSIDLAFSSGTFNWVEDLGRVFRQVHRVLKVGAPLVFSLPHPMSYLFDVGGEDAAWVARSYFDHSPISRPVGEVTLTEYPHSFSELYMGLSWASYRVELVLEPEPSPAGPRSDTWHELYRRVPRYLIVRARKEGN